MKLQLQIMIGLVVFGMISCTGLNAGFTKKKYLRIGSLNPTSDNKEPVFNASSLQHEIGSDNKVAVDFSEDQSVTFTETLLPAEISEQKETTGAEELPENDFLANVQETSDEIKRVPENVQFEKQQTSVNDPETKERKPDNLDKLYYLFAAILGGIFLCIGLIFLGNPAIFILLYVLFVAELITSIAIIVLASGLGKTVPSKEATERKQNGMAVGFIGAVISGMVVLFGILLVTGLLNI